MCFFLPLRSFHLFQQIHITFSRYNVIRKHISNFLLFKFDFSLVSGKEKKKENASTVVQRDFQPNGTDSAANVQDSFEEACDNFS